jgi:hypothetical protein
MTIPYLFDEKTIQNLLLWDQLSMAKDFADLNQNTVEALTLKQKEIFSFMCLEFLLSL